MSGESGTCPGCNVYRQGIEFLVKGQDVRCNHCIKPGKNHRGIGEEAREEYAFATKVMGFSQEDAMWLLTRQYKVSMRSVERWLA